MNHPLLCAVSRPSVRLIPRSRRSPRWPVLQLTPHSYNFLEDVTAVDWYPSEPRMQITYHILSHSLKQRVRLIVRLNGDDLALDSITSVWPSANFYEREVFDLFGVHFAGHPRLTRIMMPLDWEGHPLRKDYPVEGYR